MHFLDCMELCHATAVLQHQDAIELEAVLWLSRHRYDRVDIHRWSLRRRTCVQMIAAPRQCIRSQILLSSHVLDRVVELRECFHPASLPHGQHGLRLEVRQRLVIRAHADWMSSTLQVVSPCREC